jgi:dolichol-phosphate mannosyltransferase
MSGWTSLIIVLLFSTGIILTGIGVIGVYLGKTFEQTKNRPKYLIDEIVN